MSNMSLTLRQALPLNLKIKYTEDRIHEFCKLFSCYVPVSGKDSMVVYDIVKKLYPNTKAVYSNTGLEAPEVLEFLQKKINDLIVVRPQKSFKEVIDQYGYPIVSKMSARKLRTLKKPTPNNMCSRNLYLTGYNKKGGFSNNSKLPKKWHYLVDAPFKISEQCCDFLKKEPLKRYQKETGEKPITGSMAQESQERTRQYNDHGCSIFKGDNPICNPISFWTEKDIWDYTKQNNLGHCKIYDMGYKRTGCMFCLFGYHMENISVDDRLTLLQKTHPKMYKYIMEKLGFKQVLEWYPKKANK